LSFRCRLAPPLGTIQLYRKVPGRDHLHGEQFQRVIGQRSLEVLSDFVDQPYDRHWRNLGMTVQQTADLDDNVSVYVSRQFLHALPHGLALGVVLKINVNGSEPNQDKAIRLQTLKSVRCLIKHVEIREV
jgi:hypothetical protein